MKLFGRGKPSATEYPARPGAAQCSHPISQQFPLHEDPAEPSKITGMKCSQCGERLQA